MGAAKIAHENLHLKFQLQLLISLISRMKKVLVISSLYVCDCVFTHRISCVCVLSNWDGIAPRALFKSTFNSQVCAWLYWVQHTNNDPPESFIITGTKVNKNYEK